MRDLTNHFVLALARRQVWNADDVANTLRLLVRQHGGMFKWSQAAGEEWMYLSDSANHLQAIIWTQAPLVIATIAGWATLRTFIPAHAVEVIDIDDWNAPDYRLDRDAIRATGLPDFWPAEDYVAPTVGFSILDLRWATE